MAISFSDRLSNVVALTDALTKFGLASAQAREEARELEKDIYGRAYSENEYAELFAKRIAQIQPQMETDAAVKASGGVSDEPFNLDAPDIGPYAHPTFHQDGQMSTILKARAKDETAQYAVVALKLTNPSTILPPHDSEREARILREARHDHVIPLIETFWQPGGQFILVFPFLSQDLENLLRSGTFTKKQSAIVFGGLFEALAHIHSLGIIHRDVKPSNILLRSREGPAYLADFGIAWSPSDPQSENASQKLADVGTTSYRPPELLFGYTAYDASLDMWAAGCVLAEMVTQDHAPLFRAGALGSELALIKSMLTTLGTPNDSSWPSAKKYPDWGKVRFQDFPARDWESLLPGASPSAIDLIRQLVCYESTDRLTARQALQHPFATLVELDLVS